MANEELGSEDARRANWAVSRALEAEDRLATLKGLAPLPDDLHVDKATTVFERVSQLVNETP